jgi:hypothetical protein
MQAIDCVAAILGGAVVFGLNLAVDGGGDFFQRAHHVFEGFGGDGLGAVGEGVFGVVVGFDDEAVGAGGEGGFAHVGDEVGVAGALGGVNDDGEVGDAVDFGDDGEGEGVAAVGFEGADAAFAEDDVGVAAGHDVFGGEEEFIEGGGEAALEEYGFLLIADGVEEVVVLHVAGADLEDVGVFADECDLVDGHDFGDDGEAGLFAGFGEDFEAFFAEALEFVGGGARFEGSAAQCGCARFFDFMRTLQQLLAGFDGAGAGDEADFFAAGGGAEGAAEGDDGAVFFHFTGGHFVFGEDGHDFLHAGGVFDVFFIFRAVVAEGGDDGAFGAFDDVVAQAELFDEGGDMGDLGIGGELFHNNDHGGLRVGG